MTPKPKARYRVMVQGARLAGFYWFIYDDVEQCAVVVCRESFTTKAAAIRAGKRICREAGR